MPVDRESVAGGIDLGLTVGQVYLHLRMEGFPWQLNSYLESTVNLLTHRVHGPTVLY